jgi:hypothetical protein
MPVWDNLDTADARTKVGDRLLITGTRGEYDKTPQISDSTADICTEDLSDTEFIPSYDIPQEMIYDFFQLIGKISDERYLKFIEEMFGICIVRQDDDTCEYSIVDEDKWQRFIQAPSAVTHHGNKLGGDFIHTYGVMKSVDHMINDYVIYPFFTIATEQHINVDRLRFLALVHDYAKIYEYTWDLEIKYNTDIAVGHEVMIIDILAKVNAKLGEIFSMQEMSEMYSILLTHHGQYGKYQPGPKDKKFLEAVLLHQADMIDAKITTKVEER